MVTMYALCLYHFKTVKVNLPCIFVEHYMPAVLNPFAQPKTGPQITSKTCSNPPFIHVTTINCVIYFTFLPS